jgi:hypothetical protein
VKASRLIERLRELTGRYGDLDVVVTGVFNGGIHDFGVYPFSHYHEPQDVLIMACSGVAEKFVIDEVEQGESL